MTNHIISLFICKLYYGLEKLILENTFISNVGFLRTYDEILRQYFSLVFYYLDKYGSDAFVYDIYKEYCKIGDRDEAELFEPSHYLAQLRKSVRTIGFEFNYDTPDSKDYTFPVYPLVTSPDGQMHTATMQGGEIRKTTDIVQDLVENSVNIPKTLHFAKELIKRIQGPNWQYEIYTNFHISLLQSSLSEYPLESRKKAISDLLEWAKGYQSPPTLKQLVATMEGDVDESGVFNQVEETNHTDDGIEQQTSEPVVTAASDNSALSDAVRYLCRPVQIESSVLAANELNAVGYPDPTAEATNFKLVSIRDYSLPAALIEKSRAYREKITGYSYMTADIDVKAEFTAAPTTSGRVVLVYIPFGNSAETNDVVDPAIRATLNLTGLSGYPIRSEIDLGSQSTIGELKIPFTTPLSALTVTNAVSGQFGKLLIYVTQDISEVIPFTVFMNFSNINLSIASGASQLSATMQGDEESTSYVNYPGKGYTHVGATMTDVSLSGQKRSQIGGSPYYTSKDEMSFDDCTSTPMVIGSKNWQEGDASGTELFNFDVSANIAETATFGSGNDAITYTYPTFMFYILSIFNLYNFKMLYFHFDLAKTGLHSGKLRVLFTPRGTGGDYKLVAEKSYQWIIDCKADRSSFTIPIPYIFEKPWLQSDEIIGQLQVSVLNKIVRPSTVSANIPILAKISCEGLQGSYFTQRFLSVNVPFTSAAPPLKNESVATMQGVENTIVEEPPMNNAPLEELTHVRCKGSDATCVGEKFNHMLPCLQRMTCYGSTASVTDAVTFPAPNSIKIFGGFRPDLLSHFGQLFRFQRGSMKYMLQTAKDNISMYASLCRTMFNVGIEPSENIESQETHISPSHFINSSKNNFLEFTVPYYSNVPYVPIYSSSDNIIYTSALMKLSSNPGAVRGFRAAGPDFSLGCRMSPPAMVPSNRILPPVVQEASPSSTLPTKKQQLLQWLSVMDSRKTGNDISLSMESGTKSAQVAFPLVSVAIVTGREVSTASPDDIYILDAASQATDNWIDPDTQQRVSGTFNARTVSWINEEKFVYSLLISEQGYYKFFLPPTSNYTLGKRTNTVALPAIISETATMQSEVVNEKPVVKPRPVLKEDISLESPKTCLFELYN